MIHLKCILRDPIMFLNNLKKRELTLKLEIIL